MSIAAQCVHGVGACVIPSPSNSHRPYLLRHKPLAAVAALLVVSKLLAFGVLALTPATASLSTITTARIVQLTNNERVKAGLKPLTTSATLASAAQQKAAHMLEKDYFAHVSPDGVTPWFWMDKAGYTYQVAGENLAIDFFEAESVVAAWLNSPSHKENMLHAGYTETGVAVLTGEFQGGTSIVVVHMFGRPLGSAAPPVATPPPAEAPAVVPTSLPEVAPPPPHVAPATPRIALTKETRVRSSATVLVQGEAGLTVSVTANDKVIDQFLLSEEQPARRTLDIRAFPDGDLALRAFTTSAAGIRSEVSGSVSVVKDTAGPALDESAYTFVVSPLTDTPYTVLIPPAGSFASVALYKNEQTHGISIDRGRFFAPLTAEELQLAATDEIGNTTELILPSVAPHFSTDTEEAVTAAPRVLSGFIRRLALGIGFSVLILLALAVLIRIRIQHVGLITHGTFVLLLATAFFFL